MEKPHIEYPCWWTYAIMGKDEEDLRLAVGEVTKGVPHRVAFSKMSAQKRYVSLHVEIHVASEEERDRLFQAFKSHPRVRAVL
jgi:putative lipoic acid-binding regulatory protein